MFLHVLSGRGAAVQHPIQRDIPACHISIHHGRTGGAVRHPIGTFLPVVFQFITVGQVPLYGIPSGHSCLSILLTDIRISLILSVRQVPKGIPSANV
jgi:hypothetical protein